MTQRFVRAARVDQVRDGEMHVATVDGVRVLLTRVDGQLHAIDDTCTHTGCSLGSGELDDTVVTCPCHGSRFDVTTGDALHGPARRPVRRRAVRDSGDDVLVEA